MWWVLVALVLTAGRDQGNPCRIEELYFCKTYQFDNGTATKCSIPGEPQCSYTVWVPRVVEPCENGTSRGGGVIPDKPRVTFTWGTVKGLYR